MEVRKGVHLPVRVIDPLKFPQVKEYVWMVSVQKQVSTVSSGVIKSFA